MNPDEKHEIQRNNEIIRKGNEIREIKMQTQYTLKIDSYLLPKIQRSIELAKQKAALQVHKRDLSDQDAFDKYGELDKEETWLNAEIGRVIAREMRDLPF